MDRQAQAQMFGFPEPGEMGEREGESAAVVNEGDQEEQVVVVNEADKRKEFLARAIDLYFDTEQAIEVTANKINEYQNSAMEVGECKNDILTLQSRIQNVEETLLEYEHLELRDTNDPETIGQINDTRVNLKIKLGLLKEQFLQIPPLSLDPSERGTETGFAKLITTGVLTQEQLELYTGLIRKKELDSWFEERDGHFDQANFEKLKQEVEAAYTKKQELREALKAKLLEPLEEEPDATQEEIDAQTERVKKERSALVAKYIADSKSMREGLAPQQAVLGELKVNITNDIAKANELFNLLGLEDADEKQRAVFEYGGELDHRHREVLAQELLIADPLSISSFLQENGFTELLEEYKDNPEVQLSAERFETQRSKFEKYAGITFDAFVKLNEGSSMATFAAFLLDPLGVRGRDGAANWNLGKSEIAQNADRVILAQMREMLQKHQSIGKALYAVSLGESFKGWRDAYGSQIDKFKEGNYDNPLLLKDLFVNLYATIEGSEQKEELFKQFNLLFTTALFPPKGQGNIHSFMEEEAQDHIHEALKDNGAKLESIWGLKNTAQARTSSDSGRGSAPAAPPTPQPAPQSAPQPTAAT